MSVEKTSSASSLLAIVVGLLILAQAAWAAAPDVGLVTGLSGEVTYWHPEEKHSPAKAMAFLKIREGDHFRLPAGAQVQITFFASGRQETWEGLITLMVADQECRAAGKGPSPSPLEVKVLPAKIATRMKGVPAAVASSEFPASGLSSAGPPVGEQVRTTGTIQTMAPKKATTSPPTPRPLSALDEKAVADAEKVYQNLKNQAKAGDLTPEIFLVSVYADYGQYDKMGQVIDAMLAKRPGDLSLRKLKDWARSRATYKP